MREEILQVALKQFLKYGIRKMSVRKLIDPLAISTKTFYKYFKNKEELLEAVLNLHYKQQYQLLETYSADQNVVTLIFNIWHAAIEGEYSVNNKFFHDLHYYYPELEKKTEAAVGHRFWKKIEQIVLEGIKGGLFREDIHPEIAMEGIAVLYGSVTREREFKKFRVSTHEVFLNTIVLCIRGLCTRKGIRYLDKHISTLESSGVNRLIQ